MSVHAAPCVPAQLGPSSSSQKYSWAEIRSASVWPAQSGRLSDAWLGSPSIPRPAGHTPYHSPGRVAKPGNPEPGSYPWSTLLPHGS